MLEAIRHDVFFRWIEGYRVNMFEKDDFEIYEPTLEDLYFKVSYLDPAFDRLVDVREKVLSDLLRKVQNHPDYDPKSPTNTVLLIDSIFFDIIKFTSYVKRSCIEQFSILRLYAGESSGTLQMNMAILQKIASQLGIKSFVTEKLLIVDDESYDGGRSVIRLRLNRRVEVSSIIEMQGKINNYFLKKSDFRPLKCHGALIKLFPYSNFAQLRFTSRQDTKDNEAILNNPRYIYSLIDPFEQRQYRVDNFLGINAIEEDLNSSDEEYEDEYYNDKENDFLEIYPYSQMPYDIKYTSIGGFFLMFENNLEEYGYGFFEDYENETISKFYEILSIVSPFSYSFTKNTSFYKSEDPEKISQWASSEIFCDQYLFGCNNFFASSCPDSEFEPSSSDDDFIFQIGDLVNSYYDQLAVIVRLYDEDYTQQANLYIGNDQIQRGLELPAFKQQINLTKEKLDLLLMNPEIGLCFERFDQEEERFIPTHRMTVAPPGLAIEEDI